MRLSFEDHKKVFELLPAEKELGMRLSAAYQLIPEQFTATVIVYHKNTQYYSVGELRVEQLVDKVESTEGDPNETREN